MGNGECERDSQRIGPVGGESNALFHFLFRFELDHSFRARHCLDTDQFGLQHGVGGDRAAFFDPIAHFAPDVGAHVEASRIGGFTAEVDQ